MAANQAYIVPPVDIYQTDESIVLLADMPGINKEDLNIQISEGELTVEGAIPALDLEDQKTVHRERRQGTYYLAYTLGNMIDPNETRAQVHEGVLTLTLGKRERAKPREIKIETVE